MAAHAISLSGRFIPLGMSTRIGSGSYGTVVGFRVKDEKNETDRVAVKKIDVNDSYDPLTGARESTIHMACLRAGVPAVVPIYHVQAANGAVYMVMPWFSESLFDHIQKGRLIELTSAIYMAARFCAFLRRMAEIGVQHGDIKPHNIFLGQDVYVGDFGLAASVSVAKKIRRPDMYSPSHRPPEVRRKMAHDTRADIFSFGVVILETLVGGVLAFLSDANAAAILEGEPDAKKRMSRIETLVASRRPMNDVYCMILCEIVSGMLDPDPVTRTPANECYSSVDSLLRSLPKKP